MQLALDQSAIGDAARRRHAACHAGSIALGGKPADRDLARQTHHLTARAAGEIARAARVRQVIPFHHSARYGGDTETLRAEVLAAFRGA